MGLGLRPAASCARTIDCAGRTVVIPASFGGVLIVARVEKVESASCKRKEGEECRLEEGKRGERERKREEKEKDGWDLDPRVQISSKFALLQDCNSSDPFQD